MDKNIQELHKHIIDVGRSGDVTKLNISEIPDYHRLATELLLWRVPIFLTGVVYSLIRVPV